MERHVYELEAEIERSHWWFKVRHRLFAQRIREAELRSDAYILDIGTSTGGTLRHLREAGFSNLVGIDASKEAVAFCAKNGLDIRLANACALPFQSSSFDYVLACDIIEHMDNDLAAVREVRRVLKPGKRALFTVPALKRLWGKQDEISHHKRRYTKNSFRSVLCAGEFEIIRLYYFNYLLFLPILMTRRLSEWGGIAIKNENSVNSPAINALLETIFSIDVKTAPCLRPPFGVSLAAEVRKPC